MKFIRDLRHASIRYSHLNLPYYNQIRWQHLNEVDYGIYMIHYFIRSEEVIIQRKPIQRYLLFNPSNYKWSIIIYPSCEIFLDNKLRGLGRSFSDIKYEAIKYLKS